jgi:hypothetical protein
MIRKLADGGSGRIAFKNDEVKGSADEDIFVDRSSRSDPHKNHNWLAELYLVEENLVEQNVPRNVTIYNGVQWG